jgi:hypothetical protein
MREISVEDFIKNEASRYNRPPHDIEQILKTELANPKGAMFHMGPEEPFHISQEEIVKFFADKEARKDIKVRDEGAMEHFMSIDPAAGKPPEDISTQHPNPEPVQDPKKPKK